MYEFLQLFYNHAWTKRPRDIESQYFGMVTIQAALSHLRDQSGVTREQMAERLGVLNSRLAYLELKGSLTEAQYLALISMAAEFSMPNLAEYFGQKMRAYLRPGKRGPKRRIEV